MDAAKMAGCLLCLSLTGLDSDGARPAKTITVCLPCLDAEAARELRLEAARHGRVARYDELIIKNAQGGRLDPRLVKSMIAAESGFYTGAVSPKGARGLMQVMPDTAEEMGVAAQRLHDPEANLRAGTAYLRWLYRTAWQVYGLEGVSYRDGPDWVQRRVIAAYHAGPNILYGKPWPRKTRLYVADVLRYRRAPATKLCTRPMIWMPAKPTDEMLARL